jgi:hypothetical protein
MITFKRAVTGETSAALFVVGVAAFAVSALDPLFGPIAVFTMVMGALAAVAVWWQRSGTAHPSIREDETQVEDRTPIEPK